MNQNTAKGTVIRTKLPHKLEAIGAKVTSKLAAVPGVKSASLVFCCDSCHRKEPGEGYDVAAIREHFNSLGWESWPDGRDFCPECTKRHIASGTLEEFVRRVAAYSYDGDNDSDVSGDDEHDSLLEIVEGARELMAEIGL